MEACMLEPLPTFDPIDDEPPSQDPAQPDWRDLLSVAVREIRNAQRTERDDLRVQWKLRDEAMDRAHQALCAAWEQMSRENPARGDECPI